MLIINRHPGQSFVVAGEIKITIGEVRGEKVKVMIQAPKDISIVRTEVLEMQQILPRKIADQGPNSNLKS